MNKNKLTLVFDFDGTIVDVLAKLEDAVDIYNPLAKKFGFRVIDKNDVEDLRGLSTRELFKSLKISIFKVPIFLKEIRKELHSNIDKLKPVPGMDKVLMKLSKRGYKLGILTSNNQENVRIFLKNHDLEIFDFIYSGSSTFGKDKVMKKMLEEQNLKAENVIYFGDETRDVEASHKVGFKVVALPWGLNTEKVLRESGADWVVKEVEEILGVVESVGI